MRVLFVETSLFCEVGAWIYSSSLSWLLPTIVGSDFSCLSLVFVCHSWACAHRAPWHSIGIVLDFLIYFSITFPVTMSCSSVLIFFKDPSVFPSLSCCSHGSHSCLRIATASCLTSLVPESQKMVNSFAFPLHVELCIINTTFSFVFYSRRPVSPCSSRFNYLGKILLIDGATFDLLISTWIW